MDKIDNVAEAGKETIVIKIASSCARFMIKCIEKNVEGLKKIDKFRMEE